METNINGNAAAKRIPLIQAIHFKGLFLGLHFTDLFLRSVFGTYSCPVQALVGVAMIALGALNAEKCPMDPGLPLFLVLYGVLFVFFCYLRRPCNRAEEGANRVKRIWNIVQAVVGILLFVATLCFGFIIISSGHLRRSNRGHKYICDKLLYHFCIGYLSFSLTLLMLFFLAFICTWTYSAVVLFKKRVKMDKYQEDNNKQQEQSNC